MDVEPTVFEYEPLPTDEWLPATIEKAEPAPSPFDPEHKKQVLTCLFRVEEPAEYRGKKIPRSFGLHWPPANPTEKQMSKLFKLAEAATPETAIPGQTFKSEDLINKKVRIMVEDYTRNDGKPGQRIFKIASMDKKAVPKKAEKAEPKAEAVAAPIDY